MAAALKLVKKGPKYPVFPDATRVAPKELMKVRNFNLLVVGPPGSGKTNLAVALLTGPYRRKFRYIFMISPVAPDAKISKLKLEEERFGDDLEDIEELLEIADGERCCFLLDDATSMLRGGRDSALSNLITGGHHLKASTITCVHNLGTTPPLLKKSAHAIALARGITTAELRSLLPYLKGGLTADQLTAAYGEAERKSLPLILRQDGTILIGFDEYSV